MNRQWRLRVWRTFSQPAHLRRTGTIALLVGSWLIVFNLGDALLHGPWNSMLVLRVCLNYLTPFLVANLGLLSHQGKL